MQPQRLMLCRSFISRPVLTSQQQHPVLYKKDADVIRFIFLNLVWDSGDKPRFTLHRGKRNIESITAVT